MELLVLFAGIAAVVYLIATRSGKAISPGNANAAKTVQPVASSTRTQCSWCGTASVVCEGQYCSEACKEKLAKSMDDVHDRFEEMNS